MSLSSKELREKYLTFFEKKGHKRIASASLIPENDPTVLFTTAGMHPLVPYLMGETHPEGKRLVNVQKCIRTGDIDEVGDNWHLTFFEMLGNWSLGDYEKKEAIEFSFEFLTKELNININDLSVTCFKGDKDSPKDEIAAKVWESLGIPKERINFLNKEENWWGPAGATGPCGPDSEMFYHVTDEKEKNEEEFLALKKKGVINEIWNDVFMQYTKTSEGEIVESKQKNIDTGMGVERTYAALNKCVNVYEVDTVKPIYEKVKSLSKHFDEKNSTHIKGVRIITDHIRTATFILGDEKGIVPSNVDQGYVLRRLIRRSVRHARLIGIGEKFCCEVAKTVIKTLGETYPEIEKNKAFIFKELENEEEKFSIALEKGTAVLEKKLFFLEKGKQKELNAKGAFDLYQSYGFPIEMTKEICEEKGFKVDEKGFEKLLVEHQNLSRAGAEQKFKGGLADNSEQVTKLHTATHLFSAALRKFVNPNSVQKGSNITAERARFDFNSEERLTQEQIKQIEDWVNDVIKKECTVTMQIMNLEEAKKAKAHGVFESKYEEKVKVYSIIDKKGNIYSKEICGGPHVTTTKGLGTFKITKQEAVGAGIKRVKIVLE